jgi:hypothetical protein
MSDQASGGQSVPPFTPWGSTPKIKSSTVSRMGRSYMLAEP